MEKALDLRIQKTHRALIGAFLRLLEVKRFENITVNELCDAAMVRRATFYKHFGDKYEFFSFLVQHMQREFRSKALQPECEEVSIAPYIQMVRAALDFLDENETLVRSAMQSNAYPILLDIISEQVARDVRERLCEDERKGKRLLLAPELMAQAYTGSLNHIARWWVNHKEQITKEEIVAQITTVFEKLYAASE